MTPRRLPAALVLVATLAPFSPLGCGSGGSTGFTGPGGGHGPDSGITLSGSEAGASGGLDAYVEQGPVPVQRITLCAGECATVRAVGTGGNPPYTFSWDDGSTAATRSVCPTSTRSYSVEVTDTAPGGELGRAAETARASLTADVVSCPDGGASEGGSTADSTSDGSTPDGGASDGSRALCVGNPSFEGMPQSPGIDAPPWTNCTLTGIDTAILDQPASGGLQTFPGPSDGSTYLALSASYGIEGGGSGVVYEQLCAPMHTGVPYSFKVDLANSNGVGLTPTSLQILGGNTSCDMEETLWTSPVAGTTWTTYCATLTPTYDWSFITLELTASASAELFIDNLVPVASCP